MLKEKENVQLDIYKIDTKPKLLKSKLMVVLILIFLIVIIIMTFNNVKEIHNSYKQFKSYQEELAEIVKQQEIVEQKRKEEEEKRRLEKLPNLTDMGKENIKKIYKSEKKRAFLTFDDGPSSVTNQILDTLKQEKVKASFFVLGSSIPGREDIMKRMYTEGHYIANHGYSHVYTQIYSSPQAVLNEYNQCLEKIRGAIGVPDYNPHLFRYPGGFYGGKYADIKKQAEELLLANNIVHVDWNALNGDAETNNLSVEFELQKLKDTTEGKNSIVVLMHDAPVKRVTAEALPQIISNLKEQGYEFMNFYEIIK